jgi:hypothetical protein
MTMTAKVLGQATLTAATETALYTAPAATTASIGSIVVCNTSTTTPYTYRLYVRLAADSSTSTKQYLTYEANTDPRETVTLALALMLGPGDSLRAYTTSGTTLAFNVFGVERT